MRASYKLPVIGDWGLLRTVILGLICFLLSPNPQSQTPAFAEPPSPFAVEKIVGQPAPDFTAKDINGSPVSLSSFKGRVVLLKFWATWCPPCRTEIPSTNKLAGRLAGRGLVILAVSTDTSVSAAKDFLRKNPVTYTVLFDENQKITKTVYKAFMVPTTFLIDRKGVVVRKYFGEHDWTEPEILKEIESYL